MIDRDLLARALRFVRGARVPSAALLADSIDPPAEPPTDFRALAKQIAAALARRFEGLFLHPYLCPAGVPSIGYGATYYEDGRAVTLKDPPITREQAEALLLWMIDTVYLPAVLRLCPGVTDANRLAVLIDFAFNLGIGRLQTSTLRKRVNANTWPLVPAELRKWVMAAGQRLRGLVLRREAEASILPSIRVI